MDRTETVLDKNKTTKPRSYRFSVVMNTFSLISLISFLIFAGVFSWLMAWSMALVCGLCMVVWLIIFLINRSGYHRLAFIVGIFVSSTFSFFATILFGWSAGFFYSALIIIPLIFLNARMGKISKVILGIFVEVFVMAMYTTAVYNPAIWKLDQVVIHWLYIFNLILSVIMLSCIGHFFETAAADAESALVLLNKKLTAMASTDPVTNLVNRRTIMKRIEEEKIRVDKGDKTFALAMLDIDNFKQINDEYGHDGGDFVLTNLAQIIAMSIRKEDEVARWGGDEFLVLLSETDLEGGRIAAEKIRLRILRSPFVYRQMDIPVTITVGVGSSDTSLGIGGTIRKADQALYRGKQAGKNQVSVGDSLLFSVPDLDTKPTRLKKTN